MTGDVRIEYGLEHMIDESGDYYAIVCVEFTGKTFDKRMIGFIRGLDTDKPVVTLQESIDVVNLYKLIDRIRMEFPSLGWNE